MRTRFHCVDFFNPFPNQTLDFLRLSPPRDLPPPLSLSSDLVHSFLHGVSSFDLSLELDQFPIDDALSKFLSDVLPSPIHIEAADYSAHSEEKGEHSFDAKNNSYIEVLEFEVPQLDMSLDNSCFFEDKLELFIEILDADGNLATNEPDLTFHYPSEALESVYLIDDITSGCHMEQEPLLLEDSSPVQDKVHVNESIFPFLEVDEISLGITNALCNEEEAFLLDNIETLACIHCVEVADEYKELLGSFKIDILEQILGPALLNHRIMNVMEGSKCYQEMDIISIIELSYRDGMQAYQEETADKNSISVGILKFEESQFLDLSSYQFEDVLYNVALNSDAEICKNMPLKDLMVEDFNELIVSHELTPIDESFKSLPIPILSDYGNISSHHELVEKILGSLKPQPPSTSDDIYLDWQFLEGDYGKNERYSFCWKQVLGTDKYSIDPKSFIDGRVIFDFVFNNDTPNVTKVEDKKETFGISTTGMCQNDFSSRLNHDEWKKVEHREISSEFNSESVSSVIRSISPFDDLNFFLNPQKATSGKISKPSAKVLGGVIQFEVKMTETTVSENPFLDQIEPYATATVQLQPSDLESHQICLSSCVLELMDKIKNNYLAILRGDTGLAKIQQSNSAIDAAALLSIPKSTLLNWIKKRNDGKIFVPDGDDTTMTLITLCAIKQMAWYLCYYGVDATYIYLKHICRTLSFLEYKLSFLQNLIEDAHAKTSRDITISHPSLSLIQSVLQSQMNNSHKKILIAADRVFWLPLKKLLNFLHISYCDHQSICTHERQANIYSDIEFPEAMQHSDCLIISIEHISASFRFDKFSIILEYGGPCSSSRVSTIFPKSLGSPVLHFFKLELEESSVIKALCEGVGVPCSTCSPTELEELLDFIPTEEEYHMGPSRKNDILFKNRPNIPPAEELEQNPGGISSESSFPDTLIIVNTQNLNKEMIISRRSTYQKILAMEKRGAQVAERDLKFPVDIIISAAMCLVWYDCGNIRKKATAHDEASSSLPLCVEYIAANILTSLSFSFSCCILIFEGESNFLTAVMESSDELYAAAFNLKMDLQLFLSHSSELTDEIILNCIESSTKLTKKIYPKMPESETIAESFLTSFPSINPLSAHAILSLGGTLVEFLEWSHDRRLRSIQKFNIPNESFRLLNALCKYGEREDSRSAMTDCSSSVSSAPESRSYLCKPESLKKVENNNNPHELDIPIDDLFKFELLEQFGDDNWNQPKVSISRDNRIFEDGENFGENQESGLFCNQLFFQEKLSTRAADVAPMMTPLKTSKNIDCQMPRASTSFERKKRSYPFDGNHFNPEKAGCISSISNFNFDFSKKSRNSQEDVRGEVIDINDSFPLIDYFSSTPNKSMDLSALGIETDRYTSMGNSRIARRLSFNEGHDFPTSADIRSDFNLWDNINIDDKGQSSSKHTNLDFGKNNFSQKHQGGFLEECSDKREATYFPTRSVRERTGSALANAVLAAEPQQGSPWTKEFLNRIREKSRLRQQALPPNMSPVFPPFLENKSKGMKRKSPSLLDYYRYQGGSTKTPKKISEQNRQRKYSQPPTSTKKQKTIPSNFPTWTPLDKRARRTLSFSMGGGGGQSKLIWSDKDAQNITNRRFYQ